MPAAFAIRAFRRPHGLPLYGMSPHCRTPSRGTTSSLRIFVKWVRLYHFIVKAAFCKSQYSSPEDFVIFLSKIVNLYKQKYN